MMTLYCERCTFGTEVALTVTNGSCAVPCRHCGAVVHWHVCSVCGMGYVGGPAAPCALCAAESDEELELC
jgi:hypothetical protein